MFTYWVVGTAVIQIFLLKLAVLLLLGDRKVEILHKTQLYRFIFLTPSWLLGVFPMDQCLDLCCFLHQCCGDGTRIQS